MMKYKKINFSLITLLTFASFSLLTLSCSKNPGISMFEMNKYFESKGYQGYLELKNGPYNQGDAPALFDNPYLEDKDLGIFQESKNSYDKLDDFYRLISSSAKKDDQKYLWFGIIPRDYSTLPTLDIFFQVNHFWWEYDQLFKEKTGYMLYWEENDTLDFSSWISTYTIGIFAYLDNGPKYNFLAYSKNDSKYHSFLVDPTIEEMTLELETPNDDGKFMNQKWLEDYANHH